MPNNHQPSSSSWSCRYSGFNGFGQFGSAAERVAHTPTGTLVYVTHARAHKFTDDMRLLTSSAFESHSHTPCSVRAAR